MWKLNVINDDNAEGNGDLQVIVVRCLSSELMKKSIQF